MKAKLLGEIECIVIEPPTAKLALYASPLAGASSGLGHVERAGVTPTPLIRRDIGRLLKSDMRMLEIHLNSHDFRRASHIAGVCSAYRDAYGCRAHLDSRGYGNRGPVFCARNGAGIWPLPVAEACSST